ncbi:MAGUK p55 subfamily member 7 isoform X2 [Triplophysa rosa]|uniref:MAGUK p55 subfamily member 7 isoform X2 n=1 Tax=Triplophysa rosa TaxID=992332 RepID=UPI0025461606|nr:MAGUK p55 subfamily member 7 isoform X2 [Triplophysa rosa]
MPALSTRTGSEIGLYELLSVLPSQLQPHVESADDRSFLHAMFGERSLHSLVKIHEKLQCYEDRSPTPVLDSAGSLAQDLTEELQERGASGEIRELVRLLSKPHVKSLLSVHDIVARKSYDPELPPLPDDIDDEEDSVKIIRLVKNKEPLGATIKRDEHTGAIIVARIMRGGAADRSGLIHVGDELKEVNGIPIDDKKPEEIIRILAQSQGAITFKVVPGIKEDAPNKQPKMFVKALFDFSPEEDNAIPCKEAGLAFKKGDILQIMSQEDATWWQAKNEGNGNPRAGLVPSKHLQERRFAVWRPLTVALPQRTPSKRFNDDQDVEWVEDIEEDTEFASYLSGLHVAGLRRSFRLSRRDKKTNKSMYESKRSEQYDTADVPTYEEVMSYRRKPGERHRLVVLVGPTGVGLNELKKKLLISDPQHFGVTVPHTSRSKRQSESDGVEYHFISKHSFEADIHNNKFVEQGEYKGNYYGTSFDSVRSVMSKNKTLRHLRTAEFKPYVVFVKPPSIERLRETRKNAKVISGKDDKGSSKPFSEEDFQEMIKASQMMENQYGHLFEKVIVNDDLTTAFSQLRQALRKLETEAHWVPISWTHS